MKIGLICTLFLLGFFLSDAFAETVRIKPLSEKLTLDGKLTEKTWQRKADVDKFYLFGVTPKNFKGVDTKVYFTYDKDFIYVGARCQEPEMNKIKLSARKTDDPVWKDDALEIFFAPSEKNPNYVQIVINADGVVFDLYKKFPGTSESDITWNSGAVCKTFKGKDFWSLEAKIPLVNLPVDAPEGNWKFHIARNRACKGEAYSFVKGIKSFHDIEKFYTLSGIKIPGLTLTVKDYNPGEGQYGINRARVVLKNWSGKRVAATISTANIKTTSYIPPKTTQVLHFDWEQPFDKTECNHTVIVSEGEKILRRLSLKKELNTPFVDERNVVFFLEPNKVVKVTVPLCITTLTQQKSQIRWSVRDHKGSVMCSGLTAVRNNQALLRIFWSFITPGRYKLDLALIVNNKVVSTATRDLRLLNSPF
ncbi:MAG: hypothetical protein E7048_10725 [Lentisphaerae bacterium]|nr:hypothetical protein [Lentisphaerota bacterium]